MLMQSVFVLVSVMTFHIGHTEGTLELAVNVTVAIVYLNCSTFEATLVLLSNDTWKS